MSIDTTLPSVQRIKGRTYKVTVSKRHRPAQIHRDVNVVSHEGEVTDDNAANFELRYTDIELTRDIAKVIGNGSDNMSYNDMVRVLLEVAAKTPKKIEDMLVVLGYAPDAEAQLREHIDVQRIGSEGTLISETLPSPTSPAVMATMIGQQRRTN